METVATQAPQEVQPPYFAVSVTKLIVLWFCSLGLYGVYWFYMQWRLIKERERSDIVPAMRSIFQIFFCYSLFQHVNAAAQSNNVGRKIPAGILATGFIILSLLWRLPDPYWLVAFVSIVFLLPAQKLMNEINRQVAPNASTNARFTGANIALVVVGGLVFALALIGTFFSNQ